MENKPEATKNPAAWVAEAALDDLHEETSDAANSTDSTVDKYEAKLGSDIYSADTAKPASKREDLTIPSTVRDDQSYLNTDLSNYEDNTLETTELNKQRISIGDKLEPTENPAAWVAEATLDDLHEEISDAAHSTDSTVDKYEAKLASEIHSADTAKPASKREDLTIPSTVRDDQSYLNTDLSNYEDNTLETTELNKQRISIENKLEPTQNPAAWVAEATLDDFHEEISDAHSTDSTVDKYEAKLGSDIHSADTAKPASKREDLTIPSTVRDDQSYLTTDISNYEDRTLKTTELKKSSNRSSNTLSSGDIAQSFISATYLLTDEDNKYNTDNPKCTTSTDAIPKNVGNIKSPPPTCIYYDIQYGPVKQKKEHTPLGFDVNASSSGQESEAEHTATTIELSYEENTSKHLSENSSNSNKANDKSSSDKLPKPRALLFLERNISKNARRYIEPAMRKNTSCSSINTTFPFSRGNISNINPLDQQKSKRAGNESSTVCYVHPSIHQNSQSPSYDNAISKNQNISVRQREDSDSFNSDSTTSEELSVSAHQREDSNSSKADGTTSTELNITARQRANRDSSHSDSVIVEEQNASARQREGSDSFNSDSTNSEDQSVLARQADNSYSSSSDSTTSEELSVSAHQREDRNSSKADGTTSTELNITARQRGNRDSSHSDSVIVEEQNSSARQREGSDSFNSDSTNSEDQSVLARQADNSYSSSSDNTLVEQQSVSARQRQHSNSFNFNEVISERENVSTHQRKDNTTSEEQNVSIHQRENSDYFNPNNAILEEQNVLALQTDDTDFDGLNNTISQQEFNRIFDRLSNPDAYPSWLSTPILLPSSSLEYLKDDNSSSSSSSSEKLSINWKAFKPSASSSWRSTDSSDSFPENRCQQTRAYFKDWKCALDGYPGFYTSQYANNYTENFRQATLSSENPSSNTDPLGRSLDSSMISFPFRPSTPVSIPTPVTVTNYRSSASDEMDPILAARYREWKSQIKDFFHNFVGRTPSPSRSPPRGPNSQFEMEDLD